MIESLQRQLAEERERGAHRLQTETLMHQLIEERNEHQKRVDESSKKFEEDVMHVRVNMQKNMEKARSDSNDSLRNLNIQKRHNSDLRRRVEELEKELQLSKANSSEFIERNKEQLKREQETFQHRLELDMENIEGERSSHEKAMDEKEKQHALLLSQVEARYKAEAAATAETFKTLKLEYANKAITFEKVVEKIRDVATAAKIKAEAGMHKLKGHYEALLQDSENNEKKLSNKIIQMKWCNVLRVNAYKKRLSDSEAKFQADLESQMREASAVLEQIKGDCEVKLDSERAAHHRTKDSHEEQLGALYGEIKDKVENHAEHLDEIRDEHRFAIAEEVSKTTSEYVDKIAGLMEKKESEIEEAKSVVSREHSKKFDEMKSSLTEDKGFLEKKAKEVRGRGSRSERRGKELGARS